MVAVSGGAEKAAAAIFSYFIYPRAQGKAKKNKNRGFFSKA